LIRGKGVDVVDDLRDDVTARSAIRSFLWEHFEMGAAGGGEDDDVIIEQEWTGILAWSCDDSPWVGPVPGPGQEGAYVCAGFCGSGLSRAFMCGLSVGDLAAGEKPRQQVDKYLPDMKRVRAP
jgi:glycine/D-amino acid oxidase-like deaminating enzyme